MRRQLSSRMKHISGETIVQKYATVQYKCRGEEEISVPTLLAGLKQCAKTGNLKAGKALHLQAMDAEFHKNVYVANALIFMYSTCREISLARAVFDGVVDVRNVVLWNTLILGYVENGQSSLALSLFEVLDCEPTSFTIVAGLKALSKVAAEKQVDKESCLKKGMAIHELAKQRGFDSVIFVRNGLVEMYSKCGSMQRARAVFDTLRSKRDVVLWTTLIQGYVENGESLVALNLFTSMDCEPDQFTFVSALKACTGLLGGKEPDRQWCLEKGMAVHERAKSRKLDRDMFVLTGLVEMYSKCGNIRLARDAFDSVSRRNVAVWNTLLLGCVDNGECWMTLEIFRRMDCEPDTFTFVAALNACAGLADEDRQCCLEMGMEIHEQARKLGVEGNMFVASNLVDVYSKCGSMHQARAVFDAMRQRDVVSWTSLILGYVENGESLVAMELYERMDCEPSSVSFVAALKACSRLAADGKADEKQSYLEKGMAIHRRAKERGFDTDAFVASNLVNMYSKCGSMQQARATFDGMNSKGVVSWNALLLSYVESGDSVAAMDLFMSMDCEPTYVTFIAVLKASASVGALAFGQRMHAEVCKLGLEENQMVANCLVYLYGKCSKMATAEEMFHKMVTQDEASWNALMAGYSSMGQTSEVFYLVNMMCENGVLMDGITFVLILTACSHSGLVEEGRKWLDSMVEYGVEPTLEHYTCVVDMLGRANRLQEALTLIRSMPYEADSAAWMALLGSCKNLTNLEVGKVAFDVLKQKDHTGVAYVLLSEIYMKLGMLQEANRTEDERKANKAWKKPGEAWWCDSQGKTHRFLVGDKMERETEEKLRNLLRGREYEFDDPLCGHSEKLAIAYALVHSAAGEPIRIVKNMRVCKDCHDATSLISNMEGREIVCRDANRVHVFRDGKCSCGDYW